MINSQEAYLSLILHLRYLSDIFIRNITITHNLNIASLVNIEIPNGYI